MFDLTKLENLRMQGNRVAEWAIKQTHAGVQEGMFVSSALVHYLNYFGFTTNPEGAAEQMRMIYARALSMSMVTAPADVKEMVRQLQLATQMRMFMHDLSVIESARTDGSRHLGLATVMQANNEIAQLADQLLHRGYANEINQPVLTQPQQPINFVNQLLVRELARDQSKKEH